MTITCATKRRHGINWGRFQVIEDFDYADDLALLPATNKQLQLKTNELVRVSAKAGLYTSEHSTNILTSFHDITRLFF